MAEREVRKLGVALEPSHWPRGKRGNWAPLEATGGSGPERQRGDLAKPGALSLMATFRVVSGGDTSIHSISHPHRDY